MNFFFVSSTISHTLYEPGVFRQTEFVGQIEFPRKHSSSSTTKKFSDTNIHLEVLPTQVPYLYTNPVGH